MLVSKENLCAMVLERWNIIALQTYFWRVARHLV
jgi:hypothetical protein